ncbi:hypothetical protein PTSG_02366 [Salpingoeca rosetta]|uniref:Fork-head domain-containing protein n=1 Tax=Salpingoeca rosetta (strain ATCC 50818 / BSB-021) TaxID=946362 RepID=F2U1Z8_SALR5|nr:uncharacterized protein PTSG_02366 [Salpingoeca rosetta]EGD81650.1 hypothetical protein PTSG_02366 [Salpingoeca rosetta]|eukprot:XP_004996854.1 hypothetical protein PTSG_02366 [Salpingoeca rosetta]
MPLPTPTYAALIAVAIAGAPEKRLVLDDVYSFVGKYRRLVPAANDNWRNSVRHNLSLRKCFVKVPRRNDAGKLLSAWWTVAEEGLPKTATEYLNFFHRMRRENPGYRAEDCLDAVVAAHGVDLNSPAPPSKSKSSSKSRSRSRSRKSSTKGRSKSFTASTAPTATATAPATPATPGVPAAPRGDSGIDSSNATPGASPPHESNRAGNGNGGGLPSSLRHAAPRRMRTFSIDSDASEISTNSYDTLLWPFADRDSECSDTGSMADLHAGEDDVSLRLQCQMLHLDRASPSAYDAYTDDPFGPSPGPHSAGNSRADPFAAVDVFSTVSSSSGGGSGVVDQHTIASWVNSTMAASLNNQQHHHHHQHQQHEPPSPLTADGMQGTLSSSSSTNSLSGTVALSSVQVFQHHQQHQPADLDAQGDVFHQPSSGSSPNPWATSSHHHHQHQQQHGMTRARSSSAILPQTHTRQQQATAPPPPAPSATATTTTEAAGQQKRASLERRRNSQPNLILDRIRRSLSLEARPRSKSMKQQQQQQQMLMQQQQQQQQHQHQHQEANAAATHGGDDGTGVQPLSMSGATGRAGPGRSVFGRSLSAGAAQLQQYRKRRQQQRQQQLAAMQAGHQHHHLQQHHHQQQHQQQFQHQLQQYSQASHPPSSSSSSSYHQHQHQQQQQHQQQHHEYGEQEGEVRPRRHSHESAPYIPRIASLLMDAKPLPVLQAEDVAFINMNDVKIDNINELLSDLPQTDAQYQDTTPSTPSSYHAGSYHGFAPSGMSF